MYLTPREAGSAFPSNVHILSNLASVYDFERVSPEPIDFLVAEGALATPAVRAAFANPAWPLRLIEGMSLPEGHSWLFTGRRARLSDDRRLVPGDLDLIAAAAGIASPARGNVRCTWWIRRYDERRSTDGDLDFFQRMQAAGTHADPIAEAIVDALSGLLAAAAAGGGALLVEQLTMVLAKDPCDGLQTLTPFPHADEYYGRRETAIASLTEDGWSRQGGTLFLPAMRMSDLDRCGRYDLARVDSDLSDQLIVTPGSGDVPDLRRDAHARRKRRSQQGSAARLGGLARAERAACRAYAARRSLHAEFWRAPIECWLIRRMRVRRSRGGTGTR